MPIRLWSTVVIVVARVHEAGLDRGWPAMGTAWLRSALITRGSSRYLRFVRYSATARAWASVRPSCGILAPGLRAGGFLSHAVTASTVFGSRPAASVRRLPKVVRSGPRAPADTPRIVWHPTPAPRLKIALPSAASPARPPRA